MVPEPSSAFAWLGPAIGQEQRHIVPFYGHTFNKDTWVPEADISYFRVGESLGYVPSENWTSSFLGHDDNFGPNFCVPGLYIDPKHVDYVAELLRPGIMFCGSQAEALALSFLYSILNQLDAAEDNAWLRRLAVYADPEVQRVVLRAVAVERQEYIRHLSKARDWTGDCEDQLAIGTLRGSLPESLWIVEISIPQLFPANERKLGEIVLSGGIELGNALSEGTPFLFARLPGSYFFLESSDKDTGRHFLRVPSGLTSHVAVIRCW